MRVALLSIDASFEPDAPRAVDGRRARRVGALATALATAGANVVLAAATVDGAAPPEVVVVPVPDHPPLIPRDDPLAWTLHLANGILEATVSSLRGEPVDVLHAHDWHTAWTAAAVKATFGIPVVSTLHSIRRATGGADGGDIARQASWWLAYESRRTIVHDRRSRADIERAFSLPPGKQDVIGVGRGPWRSVAERTLGCYRRAVTEDHSSLWRGDRNDVAELRSLWSERARRART